jgi:hypothetical protein
VFIALALLEALYYRVQLNASIVAESPTAHDSFDLGQLYILNLVMGKLP